MMLAGFESTTHGEIRLNGSAINSIPPHKRGIGMVFQNYALFPHMTVEENLAFPLEARNVPKAEQQERVRRALDMVQLGAFGGRSDVMARVAPLGDVYQAGTLSGNPLATVAGLVQLRALDAGLYGPLEANTRRLAEGLVAAARRHGFSACSNAVCGMFGLFMREGPVHSFDDVAGADVELFNRFFHAMLDEGVYLAPSAFEAGFVSTAHGDAEIEATLAAADRAFARLAD